MPIITPITWMLFSNFLKLPSQASLRLDILTSRRGAEQSSSGGRGVVVGQMRRIMDSDPPDGWDIPAPGGLASRWHLSQHRVDSSDYLKHHRRGACARGHSPEAEATHGARNATLRFHVLWANPKQHPSYFLQSNTWSGGLWLAETRGRHRHWML